MDHPLIDLITAKIREAEARGEFDNLPGAGKPLPKVDNPENAVIDRIIKENGAVPEFVSLSKELRKLQERLASAKGEEARRAVMKEMSMLQARIEIAKDAYRR